MEDEEQKSTGDSIQTSDSLVVFFVVNMGTS